METLYAPWRIDYILAPKPPHTDTSIFAEIAQSSDDVANLVIARARTCFAVLNNSPTPAAICLSFLINKPLTCMVSRMRK